MQADWEFELGSGAPVIEAGWSGFADLRLDPRRAFLLPEAAQFPALAQVLLRLNAAASPVWTSKCDFFPSLAHGEFDADELDAPPASAAHAVACYIDLLPRSDEKWRAPEKIEPECRALCARLHTIPLRYCRVDLVIRRALIAPCSNNLGITAYLTACGPTPADAVSALEAALAAFADSVAPSGPPAESEEKLQ
jgi:hypothetical protein